MASVANIASLVTGDLASLAKTRARARAAIKNPLGAADSVLNRLGATTLPTVPFFGEHIIRAEAGTLPIRDLTNHRGKAKFLLSELMSGGGRQKALESTSALSALGRARLAKERSYKMYTGMLGAGAGIALTPAVQYIASPTIKTLGESLKHTPQIPELLSSYADNMVALAKTIDSQGFLPLMGVMGYSGLKRGRNLGQAIINRRARVKLLNAINAGSLSRAELETIIDTAARRGVI